MTLRVAESESIVQLAGADALWMLPLCAARCEKVKAIWSNKHVAWWGREYTGLFKMCVLFSCPPSDPPSSGGDHPAGKDGGGFAARGGWPCRLGPPWPNSDPPMLRIQPARLSVHRALLRLVLSVSGDQELWGYVGVCCRNSSVCVVKIGSRKGAWDLFHVTFFFFLIHALSKRQVTSSSQGQYMERQRSSYADVHALQAV